MNKKLKNLNLIDKNAGWHKYGCVRVNPSNSLTHEIHKFIWAYNLLKKGHQIATEVKLKSGRIVDLVDFTEGKFYEFETGKSYEKQEDFITKINIEEQVSKPKP